MDECVRLSEEVMRLEGEGKDSRKEIAEAREAAKAAKRETEAAAAREATARRAAEQVR
jgi:hypothetical protein